MGSEMCIRDRPISLEIKRALNGGNGDLGQLLAQVQAYCDGDWVMLSRDQITESLQPAHHEALNWCNQVIGTL